VGDRRLGEVEEGHELADADLASVLPEDVDELNPDRVSERLGDRSHPLRLRALDVRIDNGFATRLARRSFLLWGKLQIDGHLYTYID
jgi:hypothetical protein